MLDAMTVGSCFSGVGGLDLGLELAGFAINWQIEVDEWCQRVLAKHWPDVPRYGDIRDITGHELEPVDLICGGPPCQPFSIAGRRTGWNDERNLWPDFLRLVCAVRPRWVLAENSPRLRTSDNGWAFGEILRVLAACGYDAAWDCIPAVALGAHHRRDRLFIVAHATSDRRGPGRAGRLDTSRAWQSEQTLSPMAYTNGTTSNGARSTSQAIFRPETEQRSRRCSGISRRSWPTEPNVGRVAHGVSDRLDRLRGLGNAVVPQVAEFIGRRIVEANDDV